jgi:hypothetical protein
VIQRGEKGNRKGERGMRRRSMFRGRPTLSCATYLLTWRRRRHPVSEPRAAMSASSSAGPTATNIRAATWPTTAPESIPSN